MKSPPTHTHLCFPTFGIIRMKIASDSPGVSVEEMATHVLTLPSCHNVVVQRKLCDEDWCELLWQLFCSSPCLLSSLPPPLSIHTHTHTHTLLLLLQKNPPLRATAAVLPIMITGAMPIHSAFSPPLPPLPLSQPSG